MQALQDEPREGGYDLDRTKENVRPLRSMAHMGSFQASGTSWTRTVCDGGVMEWTHYRSRRWNVQVRSALQGSRRRADAYKTGLKRTSA